MKKMLFPLSILLVAVMILISTSFAASASAQQSPVSGIEIPLCPANPGCKPGELTFPDSQIHVRDRVLVFQSTGLNDDRVTGINTIIVNANFDASGFGPMWGTWHNQVSTCDGYWEGTYTSKVAANGYETKIVGTGYGDLAGLLIRATEVNGYLEGMIIELPGE